MHLPTPAASALARTMVVALATTGSCTQSEPTPSREPPSPTGPATRDPEPASTGTIEPASPPTNPIASPPVTLVTDPTTLHHLETNGYALGQLAFDRGDTSIVSFVDHPRFAALRRTIENDIASITRDDPKAGVGMKYAHRLFDPAWLQSDKTRFELIGVVNRLDRHPFDRKYCGEIRFVYRLAYRSTVDNTPIDSRLPMTVNVVFFQPGDNCAATAQRWRVPPALDGADLAAYLHRSVLPSRGGLKSIETNLQAVRWPSVVHPSLGGHAEYHLRVFHPQGDTLTPAPLENTPDVARLRHDDTARQQLAAWVHDNLDAIDRGTAIMPDTFATTLAVSVTPRALARIANRPWSQVLDASAVDDLDLSGRRHIGSPAALRRRLDGMSCQGCHETRSVAGFHLLGEPRDAAAVVDTLAIATSPHLESDLARRRDYANAWANGRPTDESRPHADFEIIPGYGAHCGLGDPGFATWTCAPGLTCTPSDDSDVGVCLPATAKGAGDPCETGTLHSRPVAHRDRVRNVDITTCDRQAVCNTNRVGFPQGMCTTSCSTLGDHEVCGAIVNLAQFNACLARHEPFPRCIDHAAFPAGMRACDANNRCRDDYLCARIDAGPTGACIPPYFLFQMRVDGHVM